MARLMALTLGVAVFLSWLPLQAMAQSPSPIVYISVSRVQSASLAGQSILQQVEAQRDQLQAGVTARENELKAEEQQLVAQQSILTQEAFAERRRAFERKVIVTQRYVQAISRELDRARGLAVRQLMQEVSRVLEQLSQERGFVMVMDRPLLVYARPETDVTEEVIARLNAAVPAIAVQQVRVEVDANTGDAPTAQ